MSLVIDSRAVLAANSFDSTGLAIQDLAIAIAAYEAVREGRVQPAGEVELASAGAPG